MSDFLLDLSQNPRARQLVKTLGLPLPMPEKLERAKGPWEERPLHDRAIAIGGKGALVAALAPSLQRAGADPHVVGDATAFAEGGEAFGRPAHSLDLAALPENARFWGLVFDASAISTPADLRALYDFFHPLVRTIARSGRAIVLGRPPASCGDAAAAAAQAALEGFVRSLAKEVGKRGATATLAYVAAGAEGRLGGTARFLLSPRSAFVSGQPLHLSAEAKDVYVNGGVRSLEGKVALVTGAARGIGEATARLLAAEGAKVVCLDRPDDDTLLSRVARDIGGGVLLADVTDPEAPGKIAEELRSRYGGVDIVVHNAGVTRDKTLANMKPEGWDGCIDINLGAVVRITAALEDGVLRDGGRIVCLSSVAGIAGNMGQTNYAASKAGIVGFVQSKARTLARRGITVNAIAPGFIETRLTAAIPVVIREVGRRLSNLGQGGQPEDVGQAITFLATPASQGLTGQVLRVCGGAFIGA